MSEKEWIDFGLLNNNMHFIPIDVIISKKDSRYILSEKEYSKNQTKIKKSITDFMKNNIECFNYLYQNDFIVIDELFENYYKKDINLKRLMKKKEDYILYIDVEVDARYNGVCYLQISVDNVNYDSYGYVFDKPTTEKIKTAFAEIKEKENNKCYFIKPFT